MTNFEIISMFADLAQEVESEDPIDWGFLTLDKHDTYMLVASSVVEIALKQSKDPFSEREIGLLVSTIKLTVENFVLNTRLQLQN